MRKWLCAASPAVRSSPDATISRDPEHSAHAIRGRRVLTLSRAAVAVLCVALSVVAAGCTRRLSTAERISDDVTTRWVVAEDRSAPVRPATQGASVFFATQRGEIVARDARSGDQQWRATYAYQSFPWHGVLWASGGTVLMPTVLDVVGFDATTGRRMWQYAPPNDYCGDGTHQSFTASVADSATIYVGARNAIVTAIDVRTGAIRWSWRLAKLASDTAASGRRYMSEVTGIVVGDDVVYATMKHLRDGLGAVQEPILVALDARTGALKWQREFPSYDYGFGSMIAPALTETHVVITDALAGLWGIDRGRGTVTWYVPADSGRSHAPVGPVAFDGVVFAPARDGWVTARRAQDGTLVWRSFVGHLYNELIVTERYLHANDGYFLVLLDRRSGRAMRRLTPPFRRLDGHLARVNAPTAHDGVVFLSVDQAVWSFDEP